MKNSTITTGAANQSPALKKHIQQNSTARTAKQLRSSKSTSGAANQAPSVKKHLQG